MFANYNIFEGVISFKVKNGNFIYVLKNDKALFLNNKLINNNVDSFAYTFCDGLIYVKDSKTIIDNKVFDNYSYLINSENQDNKSLVLLGELHIDGFDILSKSVYYDFNGELSSIDKLKNIIYVINKGNFIFLGSKNIIYSFKRPFNNLLWQFSNLSDYNWMQKSIYEGESEVERQAEVTKFIGIYKDVLWLVLNSGRLLGLDVTTGDLKYNLEKPINYDEENKLFLPTIFSTIDVERGIMFAIGNTSYIEINLEAPVTSYMIYDISETCRINNVEADYPGYDLVWEGDEIFIGKNELYFEKYPCYVGIFNRKSKEITWSSKELDETGRFKGVSKIDYALNKLYVLDRENTLHIFEKE